MTMELSLALRQLNSTPFPGNADSDALANWIAELAEFDGYLAGAALSALAGDTKVYSDMKAQFDLLTSSIPKKGMIAAQDEAIYGQCLEYIEAMRFVVHELTRLTRR